MYSYGPPHMAKQKQDDQLEPTYSSSVRIRDVALRTCQKQWTIGRSGERGSGISVLAAWHDDDDDDEEKKERNRQRDRQTEIFKYTSWRKKCGQKCRRNQEERKKDRKRKDLNCQSGWKWSHCLYKLFCSVINTRL